MKFVTLNPEQFEKFAKKHPNKIFLQTKEIAKLRKNRGWSPAYLGVEEKGKIIAATMAVSKPTFLGKKLFDIPGGPLIDFENTKLVDFFLKNLIKYAKSKNGYLLHIEPYYEVIERDQDGTIVEDGFDHRNAIQQLEKLGFHSVNPDNPKYLFVLELKNRKKDELFASFKQNTRNLINRTERKGVKVRELKREELGIFKQITESTSERRHFKDKSLNYYEDMYDLFAKKGQVKYIVAEVDNKPIAVAMFITYGEEVIYLFSGSDKAYMKEYNAQYAIQWQMIKYALENGFKRYNFFGIQGLPDPKAKGYGIYRFKKGFTGHVVELIGAYEVPLNKPVFELHKLLSKIRHHGQK